MKLSTQRRLNLMAGTENLSIQKASNVIAGTTGLSFQDAIGVIVENNGISTQDKLNIYAETENLSVQDVLNYLESFLPQEKLVDKVGGEGQELLFPCFKGDGSRCITIAHEDYMETSISFGIFVNNIHTDSGFLLGRYWGFYQFRFSENVLTAKVQGRAITASVDFFSSAMATYDGYNLKLYIDGTLRNTVACTLSLGYTANPWQVGAIGNSSSYSTNECANFIMTDRSLTAPEILDWHNGNNPTDLKLNFSLIGHAYGFKPDGTVITGIPSTNNCL